MKTSQLFPTLTMNRVPAAIRGTPPRWWRGDDAAVLAWGPFVVERSSFPCSGQIGIRVHVEGDARARDSVSTVHPSIAVAPLSRPAWTEEARSASDHPHTGRSAG